MRMTNTGHCSVKPHMRELGDSAVKTFSNFVGSFAQKSLKYFATAVLLCGLTSSASDKISYNKDIRPILSDNCFHCHGFDKKTRKGKFRLDVREDAVAKEAIVPGRPDKSELINRIFSTSADDVMPPPEAHKTLTAAQKDLLKRWIAAGAPYEKHWAYVPPMKPTTPAGKNGIDILVAQHLKEVGLKPSAPTDRRTLARRLYFDLIGLPPKPEDVDVFIKDKSPNAVSNLVEKLMASPQFGERMAIGWLDVVRFADTIGYHSDTARNVWPYRDYVIKAFNENKPFDQFTREQLAGDLLPNSTQEDKVASAYNRLLLSTEEGGAQAKDYEARMLTDRVRDVSAVWLGQTIGCAQCHDHKFDPITQRDFYSLGAFFADIDEPIIGGRGPGMLVPNQEQKAELNRLDDAIAVAQKNLDGEHPEWKAAFQKWQEATRNAANGDRFWKALVPAKLRSAGGAELKVEKDSSVLVKGKRPATDTYTLSFTNAFSGVKGVRIEVLPHESLPAQGPGRADNGNFVLTEVLARVRRASQTNEAPFTSARADIEQRKNLGSNEGPTWSAASVIGPHTNSDQVGWAILPEVGKAHQIVLGFATPVTIAAGGPLVIEMKQRLGAHTIGHFRIGVTTNDDALQEPLHAPLPGDIAAILSIASAQRDAQQAQALYTYFRGIAPEAEAVRKELATAQKARTEYEAKIPRCLVSATNKTPRVVRILLRGNFLIETGDIVQPTLPVYLAGAPKKDGRRLNRLDLANWLVSRDNPLTARVVMNRLWKQFFGTGLSKVVDDLGAQGELPPNQPLLDWLACEFMDSGWDMKHMVRLIVNSKTYQQTSVPSAKLLARDPLNRELAVQSRWRLDAELVRDNSLAISGLLVEKIGGPSVKPYQPDGYWENLNFPPRTYDASTGPDQYRRGLYTWWQRSYLHPSLLAFDAPTREECCADRNRSNIPQQALVLLNDPTYVEASRAFAVRIMREGGNDTRSRLTWAWRQVLSRTPRIDEVKTVEALLKKELTEYRADTASAEALLKTGQTPSPKDLDPAELAAWTNIARVILNLHETITRS
jgi:hypothetical protein